MLPLTYHKFITTSFFFWAAKKNVKNPDRAYDGFHWKFTLTCQNSTFQAFPGVYKNGQKSGAIQNFAKSFEGWVLYPKSPSQMFFFWKILKRTTFRAFWSWEVTNFFLTKPYFLPIIKFVTKIIKNQQMFILFLFPSTNLFFCSQSTSGINFMVVRLFLTKLWYFEKKNFCDLFFFGKKNY